MVVTHSFEWPGPNLSPSSLPSVNFTSEWDERAVGAPETDAAPTAMQFEDHNPITGQRASERPPSLLPAQQWVTGAYVESLGVGRVNRESEAYHVPGGWEARAVSASETTSRGSQPARRGTEG